jgi:hypothetical protein
MERELWWRLYRALRATARDVEQKYVRHPPWAIAAVLLWAALHDRPVSWACRPHCWRGRLRPHPLPDPSTVSRRARRAGFLVFANRLTERFRRRAGPAWTLVVDGKPLPVGRCSTDPDARPGPHGKGYKLHALWGDEPVPERWEVTAARAYEGAVAERLFAGLAGKGVALGDGNYEASRVYDAAAGGGYQLLAPPDGRDTGKGHRYQSPSRAVALRWFADGPGWDLLRGRGAIERAFGQLTSFPGGLGPLPAWVRRLGRVTRWVWCKLLVNAARILNRPQPMGRLQ